MTVATQSFVKSKFSFRRRSAGTSVTEVCLVEAAAQLFARQGFKAATTREIAQLADLNEATLFRYFPRKIDIFLAALESRLIRVKLSNDLQTSLAASEIPEVVLPKITAFFLNVLNSQPDLQSLLHAAAFELPEAQYLIREHIGPIFDSLCAYFQRCADKKLISGVEPQFAAIGLLGAVSAHHLFRAAYSDGTELLALGHADIYASVWLHGLAPQPAFALSPRNESELVAVP